MRVPHPIPYQGSKRRIASKILNFFPNKKIRIIEPFAGSAAVSLAAAARNIVREIVLNDTNTPLMRLWDRIIYNPEDVISTYTKMWFEQKGRERKYYDLIREEFNKTQNPDLLLYLLARCVKAAIRYNSRGEFNQSPDNRRRGARPEIIGKNILQASKILRGKTIIMSDDYRNIIADARKNDLIYMDPPYQGVSGKKDSRYYAGLSFDDFAESLRELNSRKIMYIVSYDGKSGKKQYGKTLPDDLNLMHIEIDAGISTQNTLLGRRAKTIESLYISPALAQNINSDIHHIQNIS